MIDCGRQILPLFGIWLLCWGSAVGQDASYGGWPAQDQTRNIPAGTVLDPGSSLLYIIDTGVNLRAAVGANLTGYNASLAEVNQGRGLRPNPFGVGGAQAIYDEEGNLDPDRINRNFISITNTHSRLAVTVHFRYFNDECIDVLDFLLVLSCNDTLIFDPFDFIVPRTPFNTGTRIFGPAQDFFEPIRAADFGSGRFLIFATAAGTSSEPENPGVHDDFAELRFPSEFRALIAPQNPCENLRSDGGFGRGRGVRDTNLHVFNSSAVAFNYLIGYWATAVPRESLFQAHAVNAWVRPAVDLTADDLEAASLRGAPDGDGPPLLGGLEGGDDFRILTGREPVRAADGVSEVIANDLYLRNDVHGGDTASFNDIDGDGEIDFDSWYGALGLASLMGAEPEDQLVHFLSITDDYNGSRHALDTPIGGLIDRSYNINGAATTYVLQIYNNDEILFDIDEDTPLNIPRPPAEVRFAVLKIVVDCLRVWITDIRTDATSVDDLQISDLGAIAAGLVDFLTAEVNPEVDSSLGWIRFVRDNSVRRSDGSLGLFGTWVPRGLIHDSTDEASFVTIGLQVVRFSGFGASLWLPSSSSPPLVSETGDPQCHGACPHPTQQ